MANKFLLLLQIGVDEIKPSDHVRLLGVTIATDLGLDMHLANVCKTCFFWLRQVGRISRPLDVKSIKNTDSTDLFVCHITNR